MSQPNIFIARLAQPLQAGGSETEIFLDRLTTITGEGISTSDFTLFNRGILTINPDGDGKRSFPEHVSFTGVDQTDLSLTGVVRGLSALSNSVVQENKRYHPAGTRVAVTFGTHDIADVIDYIDAEIAALTVGSSSNVSGTAGETITAGQVVYLKDDGKWWLARADQTATIYNVQLGIAQGAGTTDAAITNGVLRLGNDTNQTGLTTGTTMYVSDTPGAISATAGTNERIVGVARGTDNLYFDPVYEPNGRLKAAQSGGSAFGTPSSTNKFLTEEYLLETVVRTYDLADSPATWTKPARLTRLKVQVWGGGGAGGSSSSINPAGGGGGGGYLEKIFEASELSASHTVTIGAGGTPSGGAGGNTTFGSLLTGLGGAGGSTNGGAGGGPQGGAGSTTNGADGGSSFWGGGGGCRSASDGGTGGGSVFGGAGGAGAGSSTNGTSTFGGNGGSPGAVPGGGGKGNFNSAAGAAGGAGRCIVTEYYS